MTITVYAGPVINPLTHTSFSAYPAALVAVGPDGNILCIDQIIPPADVRTTLASRGIHHYALVLLKPGEFIMPGLVDTHTHACQFPNLGLGGSLELLDWLTTYTFPTEAKFKDLGYAERVYADVVRRVIASGTTTCCYYGSLHGDSTMRLADIVRSKGQRAFVGKCNMDWHCPDDYIEKSAKDSVVATVDLVQHIQALEPSPAQEPLVHPIITPRFAISCTEDLLTKLGNLAHAMPSVAIQTHISETHKEIQDSLEYFHADSYAGIYDKFNLLRHNTILAHAVWLTDTEIDLIAKRGAGIAHCPSSNFFLSSGMANVGKLLDHGIKVGLGTDISGGYNPSILHAIQMASIASKMLAVQAEHAHTSEETLLPNLRSHTDPKFANKKLGVATLLYLATKGGAEVCCLQDRIGSFEPGKAFDALVVSVRNETGNPAVWSFDLEQDPSPEMHLGQWLERFLFCGDNRNIKKVIVQGAVIGGQEHEA